MKIIKKSKKKNIRKLSRRDAELVTIRLIALIVSSHMNNYSAITV